MRLSDERHLGLIAAGVAFYAILALFPAMAATISIWSLFADPLIVRDTVDAVHELIPDEAYRIIQTQLNTLLATTGTSLTWTTVISLSIALYSVQSGVSALITGLNAIRGTRRRAGIARYLVSIVLTASVIAMSVMALAMIVAVPIALNFLPLGPIMAVILSILPWAVMFALLVLVLGLFYRWGPNVPDRHGWFTPGAILAAFLWAVASVAFSAYLANFGAYNRIYGSIGAVVAMMMWLYISAYIVLLGAAVNAEIRLLRRRDREGQ
ncbi:membrane protein [Albidovulum inexpectatum]|uniref:Membrane protein n=2 Tax=Albidovulum inexpectatum TaxID=196587 RepID=A0A2S5JMF9_9RHOB|nr:membrane protein [Albidovulum inexpectatum]